ncbi:MAG: glycoside hydrolase family 2 TIM barrel-domain containing protein [Eubacteriales bacterium]|nr:glycoside hydrolase family 2 TIM barrel-domain containing protein [Eubacteriales bacterium]
MKQLRTKWGKRFDREHIWQEYPRPSMVRDSYLNLNGAWEYAIVEEGRREGAGSGADAGKTERKWDGEILVPFSPECALSGVERELKPRQYLLYRRRIKLPEGFWRNPERDRILLHFGAVDQECAVYVDNELVGEHTGGYLPFTFDVTQALRRSAKRRRCAGREEAERDRVNAADCADAADCPEAVCCANAAGCAGAGSEEVHEIFVRVSDWTEERPHARGKQRLDRRGEFPDLFYTPQSGIWQTVWMECVPERFIRSVRITPLYDESAVRIEAEIAGRHGDGNRDERLEAVILDGGQEIARAESGGDSLTIPMTGFTPWSPEHPHLYDVRLTLHREMCEGADGETDTDVVRSYFGMRKLEVRRDVHEIWRFFVNNRPYFFNGVLDQGYWPESLMTPPSDEALAADIRMAKELGFNTIRKHVKVETERFYYHCDRIGMFVWQDMPNGGGRYRMAFTTVLPNALGNLVRAVGDGPARYGLFGRADAEGRAQYRRDLRGMVETLYSHVCIAAWVPFNEGWGQFDAGKATRMLRSLDGTRLINEACGWFDQRGGDMYSIHNYLRRLRVRPQKERVVALTEYGGYAWPVEGHLEREKEFGYRYYRSSEELTAAYERLLEREILPNLGRGLSAAVYTQMSDIETEINGLITYDRAVVKMDGGRLAAAHAGLYKRFREITQG